jgi:predicted metal-binding membrane protein
MAPVEGGGNPQEATTMVNTMRAPEDRRWYRLSLGAVILAAWGVLALWGASPYAGLLDHGEIGAGSLAPGAALVVFVVGWTLMTVAMMLPSSLPLVNLFRRFVAHRPDGNRLLALLLAGYLGVWAYFGALAYVGDGALHALVGWLWPRREDAPPIAALLLLVAGAYQFTPLKQMCLDKCRSPYSFLVQHWKGKHAGRDALVLGIRHGLFCLGCCWTLMLLMFAVGGASLGWMLALGALMTAERTTRTGRRLTRPLGGALILWALLDLAGALTVPFVR